MATCSCVIVLLVFSHFFVTSSSFFCASSVLPCVISIIFSCTALTFSSIFFASVSAFLASTREKKKKRRGNHFFTMIRIVIFDEWRTGVIKLATNERQTKCDFCFISVVFESSRGEFENWKKKKTNLLGKQTNLIISFHKKLFSTTRKSDFDVE